MMNYDELIADDLEISTGQIEGAVNYVLELRCDHGGMRWIKERAEAILQLRCIDINGDWGATRHCWSERSEVCGPDDRESQAICTDLIGHQLTC